MSGTPNTVIHYSSEAEKIIEATLKQTTLLPEVPGHKRLVAAPERINLRELPLDKLPTPRFLVAAPVFNDVSAFIAYVRDFKNEATRIFYTQEGFFEAVIDYHLPGGDVASHPRHGDHRAILKIKRSPEWERWEKSSEKPMSQQEFAEFIEDNARDILEPDPAEFLRIATGLQATTGATFRSAINQSNGTIQVQWDEQVNGTVKGTDQQIPTKFQVGLRPFMGCERYPVECMLRYRILSGVLRLHFKALHLDPITEAAIDLGIVPKIRDETGITPALGGHDREAYAKGL